MNDSHPQLELRIGQMGAEFKRNFLTPQLCDGSQLIIARPIAIPDGITSLDWPVPIAPVGQQKIIPFDFRLPHFTSPVGEREARI